MRPVFYVLDGHAIAYRQFFGLPMGSFSAPDGTPTNAVFGFTRILLDILEKDRPQYVAVSFDMGMSGRDELYGEYKGTREKMPDELRVQLDWIQALVRAFNMPILALEGFEADDVIGTVTQQAVAEDVDVRIITGDRDLLQLLTDHVTVQLPARDGTPDVVYDTARFRERFLLEPLQLIDLKALMGDTSDNIPGVKGIGEKTAQKLLEEYQTLDGVYENIELIKGANQRKLIDGREMAFLSRTLAAIRTDVPFALDLKQCHSHDYNVDDVLALFDQLNFRTLRNRLLKMHTPQQNASLFGDDYTDDSPTSDEDFAPPAQAEHLFEIHVVRTEEQLDALVAQLNAAAVIAFDTETTSVDQMAAELVGISLSPDGQNGWYIPVAHRAGAQLPLERVVAALRPALTNPNIPKIAHNAVYDMVVLQRFGIDVAPVTFDTMIAEWVVDSQSKNLGLKNLAYSRLKDDEGRAIYMTPISDLIGTGKNQKLFSEVPIEQAAPYAAADAVMTCRLLEPLHNEMEHSGLSELYHTLEIPLIPVLATMERAGVVIDTRFLDQMSQQLAVQMAEIEAEIHGLAGGYGTFNINSPKQLNDVLFGKLGLPTRGLKKTAQGYSTDAATLDSLLDAHPIVQKIIDFRELAKLKGTYVDALPQLINGQTGRVHTSYNQTGTATGRISSSDPNLQNIPIRTRIGREVRRAFVAPPGKLLLGVDYSQVELRVLAHYSRDETLLDAFRRGEDIHRATAAAVFGIPIETVTYEQRSFAKRVNFGLIYGMGAFRLARDSELTLQEANKFIETYFARLPRVQDYLSSTKQQARQEVGLKTLFGRRRRFPALMSGKGNRQSMMAEERAAINFPIQGTAADIIKRAMIDLHAALGKHGLKAAMILQVHDELVLEVPEEEIDATRALAIDVMEKAYALDPALRVEAEVGQNWRDMA
jgi:DNA polymerase-1